RFTHASNLELALWRLSSGEVNRAWVMRTATGTIWGRLNRRRRALGRDERGVTAVEFGLLALPFFTIIAAILQTSLVFLADQVLESAVHDAARAIRTGQAQEAGF